MSEKSTQRERFLWAGPALFTIVAVLLFAFFWWFVRA